MFFARFRTMNKLIVTLFGLLIATSVVWSQETGAARLPGDPCNGDLTTDAYAIPVVRDALNELDRVLGTRIEKEGLISGPAPLVIDFYSNASASAHFYKWRIYDNEAGTGDFKQFTDSDLKHTFLNFGKYKIKLYVSNSTCVDSTSFTVQVTESRLDCPNFFTPRSTPGENDEFRVAYKSIVSFKGSIVNRWGNVLFEWTDPGKGWDGTFKGKAVSPGVYFYLIDAKGSDGVIYKRKGDINLLE